MYVMDGPILEVDDGREDFSSHKDGEVAADRCLCGDGPLN